MQYTYDNGLAYIYINRGLKITHTVDLSDDVIIDFCGDRIVGIELLGADDREEFRDRLKALKLCKALDLH